MAFPTVEAAPFVAPVPPTAPAPALRITSSPASRWAARLLDGPGWTALRLGLDALTLGILSLVWMTASGAPGWSVSWPIALFAPLAMGFIALAGLYRRRLRVKILDGVLPLARAIATAGVCVGLACVYLTEPVPARWLVGLVVGGFVLDGSARIAVTGLQRLARVRGVLGRPTLIIGAGVIAERVARRLLAEPAYGLTPVGFLDIPLPLDTPARSLTILGGPDDFEAVVAAHGIRHVVLAYAATGDRQNVQLAHRAQRAGVEITMVPRLFEAMNDRGVYERVGGLPLVGLRLTEPNSFAFGVKHALDMGAAAVALILLSPLLLLIAALVKLSSPGPALFRQVRAGRDGVEFELLKFRTMSGAPTESAVAAAGLDVAPGGVEGVDRRTRVGRLLRRTSLDELPQFLNVLLGEMSLVGPRPERPEFVARYAGELDRYDERHRVRAGITGLAQAHGLRGKTSLADRIELDNAYIEHWSLGLDVKILLMTVVALARSAE